jgi:hypothetical protein
MLKGLHEGAVSIDEIQNAVDIHLFEAVEKGMVHRLTAVGILQGPAHLWTAFDGLEVVIVACGNPLINLDQTLFKLPFEVGQMRSDRLLEQWQARGGNQGVFVLPGLIVEEVIFKTAVADAVTAKDIPGFKTMTEQPIHQELIPVCKQLSGSTRTGGIQVAFGHVRDETQGEYPRWILTERSAFCKDVFEELDGFEQRRLHGGSRPLDALENRAEVALKLMGQVIDMLPLESRFIKGDRLGQVVSDEINLGRCQNAERFGLDGMKRRLLRDTIVCEESEHVSGFLKVFVALRVQLIHALLRRLLRAILVLSDVINQAVDQIIVQFLIAVVDKTEQIDLDGPFVELLEPENGVIRDQ